jgi:hypothetical protein
MSRSCTLSLFLAATAALLAPGLAAANLRAPGSVPHSPSSALYAPAGGLTVTGEELAFDCSERCAVTAAYAVTAAKEGRLAFEFILPVKEQVAVRVGPASAAVKVGPAEPLGEREAKGLAAAGARSFRGDRVPLYRARFEATLAAGANRIVVTYSQPLGAYERDYGYFKKGRWVQAFQYEVWPLKEWTLAPGFTAKVTVTMPRPAPGWWKRTFGQVRSIACHGMTGDKGASLAGARLTQKGRTLEYRVDLGAAALPDRLACSMGDEDLIR